MNFQNSLALAIALLLAPCTCANYNDIEEDFVKESNGNNVVRCLSAGDCNPDECCVMGMQRYSEPECRPRGESGSTCRMYNNEPENKTLHFPHVTIEYQDVYMQFCPCASGFVCSEAQCQPEAEAEGSWPVAKPEIEDEPQAGSYSSSQTHYRRPFPWALGRFH